MGKEAVTPPVDLSQVALAQAVELEQAIVMTVLENSALLPIAAAKVGPEEFVSPKWRKLYESALRLHSVNLPVDFASVWEYAGNIEFSELARALDETITGEGILESACHLVKEYSKRRGAQKALLASIDSMAQPGADLAEQYENLSQDFAKLLRDDVGVMSAEEQALATIKRIHNQEDGDMIKTGYRSIDEKIGGFARGELIILAGRPSMGKSASAANIALSMARRGHSVFYHSAEGTNHSLMCRLLSMYSRIPLTRIRRGSKNLLDTDHPKLAQAHGVIGALPLHLSDSERRWEKIKASIQNQKLRDPKLDVVVIDYIQLIRAGGNWRDNRQAEVTHISSEAKGLATGLKIVMILVCQLNREVEKRKTHRPILSDLRESGSLEQDADVVLMLYRPSYYGESNDEQEAEVCVSKNREGAVGSAALKFQGECVLFTEDDG